MIETARGLSGCAEFTPCRGNDLVAHSNGVAATVKALASDLIGEDAREIGWTMDQAVLGYAKAAVIAAR